MGELLKRWAKLPRAARWGLWGVLAIALYFGVAEPMLDAMNRWGARADSKVSELKAFARQREARKGADQAASLAVARHGAANPPSDPGVTSDAFNRRIAKVLEDHGVKRPTITTRESPLSAGSPLAIGSTADVQVERLTNEIQFEATPEQFARVLGDLERSAEVAGIARVQVRAPSGPMPAAEDDPDAPRKLRIVLAAETWQQRKKKGRAR